MNKVKSEFAYLICILFIWFGCNNKQETNTTSPFAIQFQVRDSLLSKELTFCSNKLSFRLPKNAVIRNEKEENTKQLFQLLGSNIFLASDYKAKSVLIAEDTTSKLIVSVQEIENISFNYPQDTAKIISHFTGTKQWLVSSISPLLFNRTMAIQVVQKNNNGLLNFKILVLDSPVLASPFKRNVIAQIDFLLGTNATESEMRKLESCLGTIAVKQ